jgi:hypothetical protein
MCAAVSEIGPNRLSGIAGSKMNRPCFFQSHSADWSSQILLNIVSERAQGRDVDALNAFEGLAAIHLFEQEMEHAQKSGQGLSTAGWRGQEDRPLIEHRRYTKQLGLAETGERLAEPPADPGMEAPPEGCGRDWLLDIHSLI